MCPPLRWRGMTWRGASTSWTPGSDSEQLPWLNSVLIENHLEEGGRYNVLATAPSCSVTQFIESHVTPGIVVLQCYSIIDSITS